MRGLFSVKESNSSFAEVRVGLLIEPTMEDEHEEQENEKED